MAIPNVNPEEPVSSAWGNAVADAINALQTPAFCLLGGAGPSIPNGTSSLTKVTLSASNLKEQTHPFFDDAGDRIVVPAGMEGLYRFDWYMEFAPHATGARRWAIRLDGSNYQHMYDGTATGASNEGMAGGEVLRLVAGQYFELYAAQGSGANLALPRLSFYLGRLSA